MAEDWLEKAAGAMGGQQPADPAPAADWREKAAKVVDMNGERRLRASVGIGLDSDPDAIARARKAAGITGTPTEVAERQPAAVERMAKEDTIAAQLRDTESLRKVFADPEFAKIAHDDTENLSAMEGNLRALVGAGVKETVAGFNLQKLRASSAYEKSIEEQRAALPSTGFSDTRYGISAISGLPVDKFGRALMGFDFKPLGRRPAAIAATAEQLYAKEADIHRSRAQTAALVARLSSEAADVKYSPGVQKTLEAQGFTEAMSAFVEHPLNFILETAARSAAPSASSLVGGAAGAVAGGVPGAMVGAGASSAATDFLMEFKSNLAESGIDTTDPNALLQALDDPKLMTELSRKSAAHAAFVGAFDGLTMGLAGKFMAPKELKGKLAGELVNLLNQTTVQGLGGAAGEAFGSMAAGKTAGWGELFAEFFGETITAPVDVATMRSTLVQRRAEVAATAFDREAAVAAEGQQQVEKAQTVHQQLSQLGEVARTSKLAQRSPEAVASFAQQLAEDTGIRDLYIDAQEFSQYMEQASIAPEALQQTMPEVAGQLQDAMATGGDLRIPLADYLAHIAPTEHNAVFVTHARLDPADMSQQQADEWAQTYQQQMQDRMDQILGESEDRAQVESSADVVRDSIREQIAATGRFDDATAAKYADLHRAFSIVLGQELGLRPEQVYQRFGLQVSGTLEQEPTYEGAGGPLAQPIKGLKVEDSQAAQDLISEISDFAEVSEDGLVTVYHRTSKTAAEAIKKTGSMVGKEDGLFFSTKRDGQNMGYGDTVVRLRIPADKLQLDDIFDDEAHLRLPARRGQPTSVADMLYQAPIQPQMDRAQIIAKYEALPPTHSDKGADYAISSEELQQLLDTAGDGYLYRVTLPEYLAANADTPFYEHRYVNGDVRKSISYTSNRNDALAYVRMRAEQVDDRPAEDFMIYRVRPEDMQQAGDMRLLVPSEREQGVLTLHLHAHSNVPVTEQNIVMQGAELANAVDKLQTVDTGVSYDITDFAEIDDIDLSAELEALGVTWSSDAETGAEIAPTEPVQPGTAEAGLAAGEQLPAGGGAPLARFFQSDQPESSIYKQSVKNRGLISMAEDISEMPSVISLLEQADLSTFLHETGHFFFEVYRNLANQPDVSPKITEDMQALLDFVGIESLDQWNAMSVDERRDGHEKVAEAFEVYLFEGKAPSVGLRKLFRTFHAWLTHVYRQATAYLSPDKITPEMRGVFDRMLATQDQIDEVQRQGAFRPLFATAGEAGLSDEEFRRYEALAQLRNEEALEILTHRSLRDMKWLSNAKSKELKRLQTEANATRKQVRKDVADEVYSMPVYMARRFLTHGVLPEELQLTQAQQQAISADGIGANKLSTEALKETYGEGTDAKWRKMPTGRYGWHAIGGADPDLIAEIFGFTSGDEMITKLLEADKPEDAIEAITDARMLSEHGDLTDPAVMEAAANEALHNEAHRRMLATELKRLGVATGPTAALNRAAKDYAEQKIGETLVRSLRPKQFAAAERRAAETATKAMAGGKRDEAAQAKRDQILSGHLGKAAIEAEREIQKTLDYFNKFKKMDYLKRIDPTEQDAILELLARYDLRKSVTQKQLDLRAHVNALAENGDLTEFTDIPDWIISDARRRSYKELTIDELRGLRDTIRMFATAGRNKKMLIAADTKVMIEEAKAEMVAVAAEAIPNKKANPLDEATRTLFEKASDVAGALNAPLIRVEQLIQFLDGGLADGPWHRYIFRPVANAENTRNAIDASALYKIVEKLEALPKARLQQKVYIPGIQESLTIEAIMTAALNMGNASNLLKLTEGHGWNEMQLREIVSHLNEDEVRGLQEIWDAIGELWPQIVEVERDVTGLTPKSVEPQPVTINGIELQGGYFPVVYDARFSNAGSKQADAKAGQIDGQTGFFRPKIADGFTKSRVTGAAGKIQLSGGLSVIPQHLSEVSHLIAHKRALRDVWKLLQDPEIASTIKERLGLPAFNQFTSWAHAVANGRAITDDVGAGIWSSWLNRLRRNVSLVAMGFKYTTFIAQFSGFFASMEIYRQRDIEGRTMGLRYLNKASAQFMRHPVEMTRFVFAHSDQIKNRIQSFDRDVRENFERLTGKSGNLDYIRVLAMKGTAYADLAIAVPTWLGAHQWALDNDLSPAAAVVHADKTVRLAQGSGGIKDLNAAQRAASMQFITLFFSYFAAYHGRLTSIIRDAKSENDVLRAHRMVDAAFRTFSLVILSATISELLAGRLPKCEDGDVECWAGWAAGKSVAYTFAGIPLVRDVAGALETGYGYEGTPLASLGQEMIRTLTSLSKAVEGEGDWGKVAKHAMSTAGYAAGIPGIAQLNITGGYAWDLFTGEKDLEEPSDALYFLIREPKE